MRVICADEGCGISYDDAEQWTICPHMPLCGPPQPREVDKDAGYCREHDLFGCPFHDDTDRTTDARGVVRDTKARYLGQHESAFPALGVYHARDEPRGLD